MDANLTTPNLGLHFGLHLVPNTLHDVLRGKIKLKDATYKHPYGFRVIPASMAVADLTGVDVGKLHDITLKLLGKADFVIMDCAAGLGAEAVSAIDAADEIILVTNPDMPSVVDALKTANIAKMLKKSVTGVVLNRVRGKRSELSRSEVEEMLEAPVIAEVPEDNAVAESIAMKVPVIDYNPGSPAAIEINRLAHTLVGRPFKGHGGGGTRLLDRLVNWMVR
jgi:septum site-determining protein MinD